MNRRKLVEHLREHGCEVARQGAKHEIWINPATGTMTSVPRHRTIKKGTVRAICRELDIPPPDGL